MDIQDIDYILLEKGKPCLSLIIPTHKYSRDRIQNPEVIKKAIQKAEKLLEHTAWPKEQVTQLESKLQTLKNRIDYVRLQEGLAIFISPNIFKIVLLPFTVTEKIMLGKKFEIRDIIYFNQFLEPYYLLTLSKKIVRLFKGRGRDLQEIKNDDFPKKYSKDYEYARPSRGRLIGQGLKSFERDKSVMEEKRMQVFFRTADGTLNKYLKDNMPLFIAGVEEELIEFGTISTHGKNIAGKIKGNYDIDAVHPLAEIAWKMIQENVLAAHEKMLLELKENVGRNLAIGGIVEVWRAGQEGIGLTVLVEKDYQVRGYAINDNMRLALNPPSQKYEIFPDAVNDILEITREKGGNIVIVENGMLNDFDRIAMILRY